ncbi:MAG: clan AA aspartic protease [Acidimicrobiaceae bacterium]|nr:clan AA aspartic protease [Acidimicrobiaceae bacterium]MCY4174990.1 clan AA aspartic protease [Acidimicrobiaceae bacterium]MCY4280063.1 clan AA aspartic protease [Acidimicrobiaceae bacterium]MCY4293667.1 clan AA aspartic protease [Acidimicrobiaceae bacterium]
MGYTHVNVVVRNPAEPERAWEGEFLVDTGAHDTVVPGKRLEEIGVGRLEKRGYELADGKTVNFDVGGARLSFLGRSTTTDVVFGNDDAEPLLGVIALQAIGAEMDLRNESIALRPLLRLPTMLRRDEPAGSEE